MDYLQRNSRISRRDRLWNSEIQCHMEANDNYCGKDWKKSIEMVWLSNEDARRPMAKTNFLVEPPRKEEGGHPHKLWNEGMRRMLEEMQL